LRWGEKKLKDTVFYLLWESRENTASLFMASWKKLKENTIFFFLDK
jgi:hypothetical protein